MSTRSMCAVIVVAFLALTGCDSSPQPLPAPQRIRAPNPADVEHVVFLVGDAGMARRETYPILRRLEEDIESWATASERDSAVTVLFLGDNIYPLGLNAPGSPEFAGDSAILMDQIGVARGPTARARYTQVYFLAGNHDWGLKEEFEGYVRLRNMDRFLERARAATGVSAQLVPEVGTGGPHVVDLGEHVRLLILDTAWWLLAGGAERAQHAIVLDSIEAAIRSAGDREIVMAAHHPLQTGGPHGGEVSFWRTLGVQYLLVRSGAILQDISSVPYRDLERGLRAIFANTRPPLAFVGGHDHSLQIFGALESTDPTFSIISGSASKLSTVVGAEGMIFGRAAPGYMRMVVRNDGEVSLYVEAAPESFHSCPTSGPDRSACMAEGMTAFQTVHSQRLRAAD